jgi:hypothetical protein
LKSLPSTTINVTFETGNGKSSGHYTGVLLWTLLEKAGLVDEPGKNASLRHTLLVTGHAAMPSLWQLESSIPIMKEKP